MGTPMVKTVLTFLSLVSFISTQAHLPDHLQKVQDLSEVSVVLLNADKTPRCQMTGNAFIEGLRQCDEDDIIYAQMFGADSVQQAGVGGKIFMGLSALILAGGNAFFSCEAAHDRDETNSDEFVEDLDEVAWRGLAASAVHSLVGLVVMGKQQLVASVLWGLGIQVPTGYVAYFLCNNGLDKLVDFVKKDGEEEIEEEDDVVLEVIEEPAPVEVDPQTTLAPPDYVSYDYTAVGSDASFSLSFDNVPKRRGGGYYYVEVFTDAACTQVVGGSLSSGGGAVEVEVLSLTAGIYSFYAITRTPNGDEASACTPVLENYELEKHLRLALADGVVLPEELDSALGAGGVQDEDDDGDDDEEAETAAEAATPAL